jgi:prevent-host-death family protein
MAEIGAFEAKNTLGDLLQRVAKGEEITISRRGKPVARLVPVIEQPDPHRGRRAAAALRALAADLAAEPGMDLSDILAWRNEGRR